MACFHLMKGYRSRKVGPSGKRAIVFSPRDGFFDLPVLVPCGQCWGCRLERSRQWAIRCMHEAAMHAENCFLTLTYDDLHLPHGGSLVKGDFQKFMKRLRKRFEDRRVRFFHCGEYGDKNGRPHYHACLFGFDFPDKYFWCERKGFRVWRSPILESLWTLGQSELGSVTFESAAYVARYIMKKVTGPNAEDHYTVVDVASGEIVAKTPEYTTMSRRPGVGKPWLDKFKCDVYPRDGVVVRGRLMKPPRYYDEFMDEAVRRRVTRKRLKYLKDEDQTAERLRVREKFLIGKMRVFNPRDGV